MRNRFRIANLIQLGVNKDLSFKGNRYTDSSGVGNTNSTRKDSPKELLSIVDKSSQPEPLTPIFQTKLSTRGRYQNYLAWRS